MSRGGRRRRGRRGGSHPAQKPQSEQRSGQPVGSTSRRRRRRKPADASVLESMSSRPATLQLLPADGTVLEELISDLKTEYGTPSTPQEYRLTIRVLGEDRDRPVPQAESETPSGPEQESTPADTQPAKRRRSRRRGRRRRPDDTIGESEATGALEAVQIETAEDPEP